MVTSEVDMLTPPAASLMAIIITAQSGPTSLSHDNGSAPANPVPAALFRLEGEFIVESLIDNTAAPDSLQSLAAELNDHMREFMAQHELYSADFRPVVVPGGKAVVLHTPDFGKKPGNIFWELPDTETRVAHVWKWEPGGWAKVPPIPCQEVLADASRGNTLSIVGSPGYALIDLQTGQRLDYNARELGELHVSGHATFISIGDQFIRCGTLDADMNITALHTLARGKDVLVEDIDWYDVGPVWLCGGAKAMIGECWLIDVATGAVTRPSTTWEVRHNPRATTPIIEKYGKPMEYAMFDVDCSTGELILGDPVNFTARTRGCRLVDVLPEIDRMIVMETGWIPSGWGHYEIRTLNDARPRKIRGGFEGLLVP